MFMRQILADAISKFQKITRQMLCDKCSKNDVTLIPPANVIWRENYVNPQNADVIWRENSARWGVLNYSPQPSASVDNANLALRILDIILNLIQ
jgi:hypothetical protein